MIEARNLTKRFGKVVAVDSINFRIEAGRVVGFLGPNGAGKTTTIRMIAGFIPPSAGRILIDSVDLAADSLGVRRRIGYLPESTPLYTDMRVREYLKYRAKLFGIPRPRRKSAIDAVIRRCWLEDVRRRPIGQLSKGYRQRVGLASALLHNPPILILDEPTVGLDPGQIREVRDLIRELAGAHTVLLSTHILPEVERVCDEVIMIMNGRIRAHSPVSDLRSAEARQGRIIVETNDKDAESHLRSLKHVQSVELLAELEGWRRVAVRATPHAGNVRESIQSRLTADGSSVRELHQETPTMEDIFFHLSERKADSA